jgi:hypothetical protein
MSLTPIWILQWSTSPETEKRPNYTADHLAKLINDAVEQGKKDGATASEREGMAIFAKALRGKLDHWRDDNTVHASVPLYEIDNLLKDWNL